ncbi:hypothetical protein [Nostoc sp. CCY 9925]|uniref:hypothetical protein n=1 Tax=Nostoc sp. CCY 9925 TaxID=3103865 RepID=UPI0039C6C2B0
MAILKLEDDTILTDINDIGQELAPLNIQLNCWAIGDNRELHRLLAEDSLVETSIGLTQKLSETLIPLCPLW